MKGAFRCVSIFTLATGDLVWMCTLNMPLWIVLDTLSVCCEVLLFASVTCVCVCVVLVFDSASLLTLPGHTKGLGVWILVDSRDSWKQQNTQQNTMYKKNEHSLQGILDFICFWHILKFSLLVASLNSVSSWRTSQISLGSNDTYNRCECLCLINTKSDGFIAFVYR